MPALCPAWCSCLGNHRRPAGSSSAWPFRALWGPLLGGTAPRTASCSHCRYLKQILFFTTWGSNPVCTRSTRKSLWEFFNSNLRRYKWLILFPFHVLYLFVRMSLCWRQHIMPKMCALFCLVNIKKHSFLTSFDEFFRVKHVVLTRYRSAQPLCV